MATTVRPRCFLDLQHGTDPAGRVVIELFTDKTPKTCENFRALCTGSKSAELCYISTIFHRVIEEFMIQGGDITRGDGKGGMSIYGDTFEDENLGWCDIDKEGLVCMANRGKDTNSSQFFITCAPCDHLNGKHTVFGHVVAGMQFVKQIETVKVDASDKPTVDNRHGIGNGRGIAVAVAIGATAEVGAEVEVRATPVAVAGAEMGRGTWTETGVGREAGAGASQTAISGDETLGPAGGTIARGPRRRTTNRKNPPRLILQDMHPVRDRPGGRHRPWTSGATRIRRATIDPEDHTLGLVRGPVTATGPGAITTTTTLRKSVGGSERRRNGKVSDGSKSSVIRGPTARRLRGMTATWSMMQERK
ncbi:Phosphatase [Orbilia brochopaga]|nr:Phosphatase [Drechslerella brochopaga]